MTKLRMRQAIVAALADEMEHDESVVLFGEDVAVAGGPFKTSEGLLERFGPLRVRDTPISEMGFLGAAVGAAATGLRPVVEIMFVEFLGVALDQLSTEAAKFHYLSGGRVSVPMVMRASVGSGLGFGCQHSQTLETWLYATPGLKLAVTSSPATAYGLLRAAIRDDNPVAFFEPRALYGERAEVETGEAGIIPLGEARVCRDGDDITIVALGNMVPVTEQAAEAGAWSGEVIDLQTLIPWDTETVLQSVAKTGRLAIVEENPYSGGWGTEVASHVAGELFGELQAPVMRITCPDVPVPFSQHLESRYPPDAAYVQRQITALLDTGKLPTHWWQQEGYAQ